MAKLFGYPIILIAEEDEDSGGGGGGGGGSTNAEASPSATQPDVEAASLSAGLPQRENNPFPLFLESGSAPVTDSQSDPDNFFFIDFFGRESHEIETAGEGRNQTQRIAHHICGGFDDVMEVEGEIELGLGIGAPAASGELRGGDSVREDNNKETESGRVGVGADLAHLDDFLFGSLEDALFCEEGDMLMADDEVLEWGSSQNGITLELEAVRASLFPRVEEEEEEEEEEALPLRTGLDQNTGSQFYSRVDFDMLIESLDDTSFMDMDDDFFLRMFPETGETTHGDYDDVLLESFNQVPPPSTITRTRPASKRVVDELPVVEITSEELSKGRIVCAICIGDVVAEEKVTRLPCRHYYHGECIVPWLGMKNTCPVCRFELPTDDL